jgi:hypothetical protein
MLRSEIPPNKTGAYVRYKGTAYECHERKCSRRNSAERATSSSALLPDSATRTEPGSTDPRTPPPTPQTGSIFNPQRDSEIDADALRRRPL